MMEKREIAIILQDPPPSTGNWVYEYNRLLRLHFDADERFGATYFYWREIRTSFHERSLEESWFDFDDVLLGNSQFWLLPELLALPKKRVYAHVHTLPGHMFEPYMFKNPSFAGIDELLPQIKCAFFNSKYQLEETRSNNIAPASRITGFPIDHEMLVQFIAPKVENLIVFNQRLSLEKNPAIACLIARHYSRQGCRVEVLRGDESDYDGAGAAYVTALSRAGAVVRTVNKVEYWRRLGEAKVVVHFSAFDSFSVAAAEAVILGAALVAPNAMCYPEIFEGSGLYSPYALDDIVAKVDAALRVEPSSPSNRRWDPPEIFSVYAGVILGGGE